MIDSFFVVQSIFYSSIVPFSCEAVVFLPFPVGFHLVMFNACAVSAGMYQIREANQMVEEFMLAANVSVAEKILKHFPLCSLLRYIGVHLTFAHTLSSVPGRPPLFSLQSLCYKLTMMVSSLPLFPTLSNTV